VRGTTPRLLAARRRRCSLATATTRRFGVVPTLRADLPGTADLNFFGSTAKNHHADIYPPFMAE
jgi:hypothetical protein